MVSIIMTWTRKISNDCNLYDGDGNSCIDDDDNNNNNNSSSNNNRNNDSNNNNNALLNSREEDQVFRENQYTYSL